MQWESTGRTYTDVCDIDSSKRTKFNVLGIYAKGGGWWVRKGVFIHCHIVVKKTRLLNVVKISDI